MLKYVDYDVVFQEIPDEVTLAINLSNCPNGCIGCHSPQLMRNIGKDLTENELLGLLGTYGRNITCVCFMGGDADPKSVSEMAGVVRSYGKHNLKVGWYSGKNAFPESCSLERFDYVKLGPYVESKGCLKERTTNQRLYKIGKDLTKEDITYRFWKEH